MLGKYKENPVPQETMANIPIENNSQGRLGVLPDDKLASRNDVSESDDYRSIDMRDPFYGVIRARVEKEYYDSLKTDDPESYREKVKDWLDGIIDKILPDILKDKGE